MNLARWEQLMRRLGVKPSLETAQRTYRTLVAAYAEPHRHYHTVEHIDACLPLLDEYAHLAQSAVESETALWFHDAVYKLLSSQNEEESAAWSSQFLRDIGVNEARINRVHALILATKHNSAPQSGDAALVVDIDLSILGREPEQYKRFESAIRKEYKLVPRMLYRRKRREILQSFLNRKYIYTHPSLRERFEAQARTNLHSAIKALE